MKTEDCFIYPRPSFCSAVRLYIGGTCRLHFKGLKLKNLQLGYAFPERITSKLKMQRLYVYANAQNLFTVMWKKGYEGYDPERNTFDAGGSPYPTPRIFTFGLNLNF